MTASMFILSSLWFFLNHIFSIGGNNLEADLFITCYGVLVICLYIESNIYSFLKHPNSYINPVLYAISLGGDTDTIAGMTGAISGAYLSIEAIPDRWTCTLENRPYIEALAEKLWQLAK